MSAFKINFLQLANNDGWINQVPIETFYNAEGQVIGHRTIGDYTFGNKYKHSNKTQTKIKTTNKKDKK